MRILHSDSGLESNGLNQTHLHDSPVHAELLRYGAVFAVSALLAIARFLGLGSYPTATSNDAGNWLTLARIVLGDNWLSVHSNPIWPFNQLTIYNLMTPWIPVLPLAFFVSVLGGAIGLKVFMVFASVLTVPSAFFLLRQLKLPPIQAFLVSLVFTSIPQNATIFSWGNYDGLFGLSFTLVTLALLLRYIGRPKKRILALASLSYALTAGSDAMFFTFLSVTFALMVLLRILRRESPWRLAAPFLGGLVLSAVFAPVYIDIFLSRSSHASALLEPASFLSGVYNSYLGFLPNLPVLLGLLVVSLVYVHLFVKGDVRMMVLSTALAAVLVDYFFFAYRPVRFWYMIDIPALIVFGLIFTDIWFWVSRLKPPSHPRTVKAAGLFLLLLLVFYLVQGGYALTTSSYKFYSDLDARKLDALYWMRSSIPATSVVLSSPNTPNSPHFDFWIGGLAERRAIGEEYSFVPNSPDLTFASESFRAHLAALALKGNLLLENGMVMSADGFPYSSPFRPLVGMYVGDYQPVAYLAWKKASFKVVGMQPGSPVSNVSLSSFREASNFTLAKTLDYVSVSYSYLSGTRSGPTITFNETLRYGDPTVFLSLSWRGGEQKLLAAEVQLYFMVPVVFHVDGGPNATFSALDKFGDWVSGSVSATSSGGATEVVFHGTGSDSTYASVKFLTGTSSVPTLQMAITFHVFRNVQEVSFYTFDSIRNALHFDYVVVVNSWWYELEFIKTVGTPVYSNSEVTVFRLGQGGPGG